MLSNSKLKHQHSEKSHEENCHNHNSVKHRNTSFHSTDPVKQIKDKIVVKDKSLGSVLLTSREKEKGKLIKILSEPKKRHSCSSINLLNRFDSSKLDRDNFTTDLREREKDRLAAIFASSSYQFSKPSNYQIYKNLNSGICLDDNERLLLNNTRTRLPCTNYNEKNFTEDQKTDNYISRPLLARKEKSANQKNNIPEILVSEHLEDLSHINSKANPESDRNAMVRIGEFSPLNPNHPVGKPMLGVGEYEERRQLFLDQRKQEYNEYLLQSHQVSRVQSPTPDNSDHNLNHHLKNAATQTEWEGEAGHCQRLEKSMTRSPNSSFEAEEYIPAPHRTSPIPKCFDGLSEKEIKEYLYREELRKQIEEKYRLKEEMKRREAEEDAKLEAKIQRDQEEMKRQFEAERIHRLELAIRKKEQEDIIRQRLAKEQLRALQESKAKKKQLLAKSTSPRDNFSPRSRTDYGMQTLSQSLPANCDAHKALSDVHDVLRQPLLEVQDYQLLSTEHSPPEKDVPSKNVSALEQPLNVIKGPLRTFSPPIHKVKEVDVLAQKSVLNPGPSRKVSQETQSEPSPYPSQNVREKIREVDKLLRQPLLSESFQVLPPMSPPLLHATIPPPSLYHPANSVRSPSVPASGNDERTNPEVLEEKWKVPYVERYNVAPPDVFTKHNRSVLTQLGAFRRHLQQERLKMEKRVIDDSP